MTHDVLDWLAPFAQRSVRSPLAAGKRAAQPVRAAVQAAAGTPQSLAQRIARTRRGLRATLARTAVPPELRPRRDAFDRAVSAAARLAGARPKGTAPGAENRHARPEAISMGTPAPQGCSVRELVDLAYGSLDAGDRRDALVLLASLGALLGGAPRASFETALALLRIARPREACEFLQQAAEGMTDTEGFVHALLAQLWCSAGDPRWVAAARRVLATGNDLDARARCAQLLGAAGLA